MKQLKVETGARIKVADAVPNCEERVVIMSSQPDPEVQWNCAQVCQQTVNLPGFAKTLQCIHILSQRDTN